jgi:outer membrane protein assembly factor BamB
MATNIVGATGIDKVQDGTIVNADINASAAIVASKLTGITSTRIHAFAVNAAGQLEWTHSESNIDLQTTSGVDIYRDVVIGSSDQVYSINSDGQLICTFT